jgi:hypothetical protein
MKTTSLIRSLAVALALGATALSAQVPQLLNYQGRVVSNGTNFTGNGLFKFALVNTAGSTTFWSNDGTSAAGSQPAAAVTLAVSSGLYAVLLGDATLPGMTAIPASVFTNSDVRLRVWFNDGVTGSQLLTPDQRIAAVGYAMMGANVPDGAITTAKLADGAVTGGKIAGSTIATANLAANSVNSGHIIDGQVATADLGDGAVTSLKLADGTVVTVDLANNAVTTAKVLDGTLVGADLANNTVTSVQLADSIALGDSSTSGQFDVFNSSLSAPSIRLFGNNSQISTYGSDGQEQIRLWGLSYGELLLNNSLSNNATAVRLSAEGSSGGRLSLNNTNGASRAALSGANSGGSLTLNQADGSTGVSLLGDSGGAGYLSVRGTNGFTRASLDGSDSGGGSMRLYESDGTETLTATAQGNGNLYLRQGDGSTSVALYGNNGTGGGGVTVLRDDGTFAGQLTVANATQDDGYLGLANRAGNTRFYARASSGSDSQGGYVGIRNAAGVETITLNGDNDAAGDGRITTMELQITGGSDLSEQFDITASEATPLPGMVVCIDPKNPGQLMLSSRAHDRTVAGIVSGAGGVKPGMLMGQRGTAADGKHPVALTGRVYCWMDASHGAIEPGDLITTSDTPGHGMKVLHHTQAQGAILGKAMTGLAEGKGLVLVLVSLQ